MHRNDARERRFTGHPGSKTPRYIIERGGTLAATSLKPKNRAKWGRHKAALRKREQIAARSAHVLPGSSHYDEDAVAKEMIA